MNTNNISSLEKNYLNIKINTLTSHIIALVIFANAFQIAFMSFGIYFGIWIEYALIAVLYIINKFIFNKSYIITLLAIITLLLLYSIVFFNNDYSFTYFKEFILYSLPLLLIFMIKIDYKKLSRTLFKYSLIGSSLYIFILVFNNQTFSIDYMTYGYHSIFFATYVFIYSYYNKYVFTFIYSLLSIILTFIYGPRGGVIVVGAMLGIMIIFGLKKSLFKKIALLIGILFFSIYGVSIIKYILSILIFKYEIDNYSIYQFYNMLSALNFREILGSRYHIYNNAISYIQEEPLVGLGIGGFHSKVGVFPHNVFLDIFVTFGLIVGSLFLAFLIYIGLKNLKLKNNLEIKIIFIFAVSNLSRLLVSKTFVYDPSMWLYISFCLGSYLTYKKGWREINDFNYNTHL